MVHNIQNFMNGYSRLKNEEPKHFVYDIPKSEKCDRCRSCPPTLRLINWDTGLLEFICMKCRKKDPKIKKLKIKKVT